MGIIKEFLQVREQRKHLDAMQAQLNDILSGLELSTNNRYRGNKYPDYESMTNQLSRMYMGRADWGCDTAKTIIELRAAFTVAGGVTINPNKEEGFDDKKAQREIEFIKEFMDINNLDEEVPFDWAKEAEIEGKFLATLNYNPLIKNIDCRFVPWTQHKYTVGSSPNDYAKYEKVQYKLNGNGQDIKLDPDKFVYKKFGGRTHCVNETPSRTALVIGKIENIDRAFWDWRKINFLFSSPTPVVETKDEESAKSMRDNMHKKNWKLGKFIATSGTFKIIEVGVASKESIRDEIVSYMKSISGSTGIPPHFLGMPDLMSNRSVSNDLFDLIEAQVVKERRIWIGCYKELFAKVLVMANKNMNKSFNPNAIEVNIPQVSENKMREIVETWLPLYQSNVIDIETMLSKIPDIDIESIKKNRIKETIDIIEELKNKDREDARNKSLEEEENLIS